MCARAGGPGYFRNAGPSEQPGGHGFLDFGRSVNQGGAGGQIVPVTLLFASVFLDLPTALGGVVLEDLYFTIDE